MKSLWLSGWIVLCLSDAPLALADDTSAQTVQENAASSETLRVISYNVQFLPKVVESRNKRPHPAYRALKIADATSKYDIVGLQETFNDRWRKSIIKLVEKRWESKLDFVESPTPKGFYTSGGCLFFSRWPVMASGAKVFENYSKPADYGYKSDGYCAKGVIHARISCCENSAADSKTVVDVFVTHLEAYVDDLRKLQFNELATFIKAQSDPQYPALILGDMNVEGAQSFRNDPDSEYSTLIYQLETIRPEGELIDVWPHLRNDALGGTDDQESSDQGRRIDYIFVVNPTRNHAQLVPVGVEVKLFQDPQVVALSCHNAVTTELEWQLP